MMQFMNDGDPLFENNVLTYVPLLSVNRQLAIVGLFLPVAYTLRDTRLYQRVLFVYGSAGIALIAFLWLIQRAFNVQLIGG